MPDPEQLLQPCPNCATLLDVSAEEPFAQVHCPICGTSIRVRRQFNNYAIEEQLGSGGMGAVYRAIDHNLQRPVALKLLKHEYSADEEYIAKFENEARITASINHPHVVKVFSFGSDHGLFYIAMELVDKGSLDDLIGLQGRVAEAQVLEVAIQAAEGLQAAHGRGLIHRDVKPANILFADAHTAKLVDFGLALLMEHEAEARGEVWGTPYYVAPEKLNKEPEDFRSDIYSLGGTLFHAVAGRPPFEAETASLVALKHIKNKAVSLQAFAPNVSGATAYVINRMLNKDPEQRYQSYDELLEHLRYAQTQLAESSVRTGRPPARQRVVVGGGSQEQVMLWTTLGLIALLIAGGISAYVFRDRFFGSGWDTAVPGASRSEGGGPEAKYREARGLMNSDPSSAAEAFRSLAGDEEFPQPLRNWAKFHLGLSLLLDGRLSDARAAFSDLQRTADFSKDAATLRLVDFFSNTAERMASDRAVPAAVAGQFDATTEEALSLLVFALKDWHLEKLADAEALMRAFLEGKRPLELAWIDTCKPIAEPYFNDLQTVVQLQKKVTAAKSPEQKRAIVAEIPKARDGLKVGGSALVEISRMKLALERELGALDTADEKALAARRGAELERWKALRAAVEAEIRAFHLAAARRQLGAFKPEFDEARQRQAMLQKRVKWLTEFRDQLAEDARQKPFSGRVQRAKGGVIPGQIRTLGEEGVKVSSPYGSIDVNWSDISPATVYQMALGYIPKEAGDGADRRWRLGVYAMTMGLSKDGRRLLAEAASENEGYREELEVFFELAGTQ